ncbi:uncharacterized protein LOC129262428 [Lytechinus pictus]|uniref:uncharacterized protein LOC129262428 n=1 Tax=Lytechinus pictus TaxID=7653 RepID=UPI0030B9F3F2
MASEMKVLSKSQVRESLKDKNNLTIKYDGTTKGRVGHLTEVEVASKEKTFLVGVSQQVGGAADEYVRTIEEACDAISPDILCNKTTNTMTDRCITNDSVDKKLEKEKNIHLNKFRCAMHPLDTIAKEVNKALKKMDDVHDRTRKMPFNKGGECNVQAFIRVGSKLFNSESCGDSTDLRSFLKGRGHQKVLPRWVGNRFDILFSSAGLLYHIGPSIVEYFRTVTKPSNDLHRSFVNAWNDKNICHLRCLGLMGHLVTHPWMEAASQDLNILEMNANYHSAVQVLERWAGNPSSLLRDQHTIFSSDPMRDDIFQSLVSPPYEDQMEEPMRGMLMAALEVTKRQLQSQLPGGVFWEPSVEVREQAASCSSTNISGERNFARVDSHLHHARNISVGKLESKVMFKCNDTATWLKSQSEERRKRLVGSAIKAGVTERKKEKVKKQRYKEQVQQRVRDKQRKLSEKAEKERNKIEELIESVLQHGLYEEQNQCELLENISKTRAMGILKNQINFRKKILCQDMGKHSLSKSSVEELKNILFSGPQLEDDDFLKNLRDPTQVLNRMFAHKWEEEGKEVWYNGRVTAWKEEYEVIYDGNREVFFMTVSEFLTDVHLGDICFISM